MPMSSSERELRNPEVNRIIEESRKDYLAGRTRPAEEFLAELNEERQAGDHEGR